MSSTEPTPQDSPRRRRSPLAVASVAAAVLLAGGGGAYLATAASDDGSATPAAGRATPPPLALDGHTGTPGIAPGEPDPGGVVYRARGELPDGPDSAHLYRPRGTVGAGEVARLAKALGVTGTPRLDGSAWKVGPEKDGSGSHLQVGREAPGTWTLGAAPTGDDCRKATRCPSGGGASAGGFPGGRPVSEEAAEKAAAPVLKALGQDDAKLDATQLMGAVRVVNADPVVGGLPTYGWSTGVQVGPDGRVVGGSGRLKEPAKGDEYPVIGADKALELLNRSSGDGRVGIGGCATPAPVERGDAEPAAPCEPERTAKKETVTIGSAVFGLAAQFTEGRPALVPSWLFEVEPKGGAEPFTITYPAVSPAHLAPAPAPTRPELPDASGRRVESYRVDGAGRKLTVTFWGGVCSTYTVKAAESATQVRVTVVESPPEPERYCIAIAQEQTASVTLDKPLGDRKVVDAAGGTAVPRK
ncbi:hypothetical protein [Streptomyces sp. NPDC006368]|uniref:hypothetical protein n=1 Tax=Streptomyces sp. NPDC006368 TaxID=3156760 RepID=UPI0033A493D5